MKLDSHRQKKNGEMSKSFRKTRTKTLGTDKFLEQSLHPLLKEE